MPSPSTCRRLPAYRVPRTGERFRPEKRITICTLQTMINEYRAYSSGYFDLIVIDECHRCIYGEYRRVLDHFDAVKVGLTATPLVGRLARGCGPRGRRVQSATRSRFFEVERADLPLHAQGGIDGGLSRPLPHLPRPDRQDGGRAAASRSGATRSTGRRSTRVARAALEEAFGGERRRSRSNPSALERTLHHPRAQPGDGARIPRGAGEGLYRARTGCAVHRAGARRSSSPSPSATPRRSPRMFDEAFADKKPDPTTRYADFVVSGMGAEDTVDAPTLIGGSRRSRSRKSSSR